MKSEVQKGSYQFEKLESRHREAEFLAERAQMRLEGFVDLLHRHQIPATGKALEVGCGQGIRTGIIARNFPGLEVLGLDRSPELLAEAESSFKNSELKNLKFLSGDLYALPLAVDTFDFIYARLVFMHLENPTAALASLMRVLKPGGKILIEDADRDCMFFEPAPKSFADFWRKIQSAQRRLGGDPNIGRKLAPLLKQSGFSKVQIEVQNILGEGSDIKFLARTLMPSLNLYLVPEDRAEGEEAIKDLHRLAEDPSATFYHFWFAISGVKP